MLERDLNFVYDIEDWLQQAYEAGKSGESLEIENVDVDEEDL